ncbi:hypothetical protein CP532_3181 [Ophiocordyceps camponoti-leonardi (nom. inval.)]|nr:hypothetical protein CP532_3181 [Ophiocordyceps camponoti-leonardi (nom. inval.)]
MKHANRILLAMCGSLLAGLTTAETKTVTIKVGNGGQAEVVSGNQSSTVGGGGSRGTGGQSSNNAAAVGAPQDFVIMSGGGADMYAPNFINAAVGSKVTVQFNTGNHTITEGFAEEACKPLQGKNGTGLSSGHIPYKEGQKTVGTFTFSVNDTNCRYYYCATGPHCMRAQIMTINCSPQEFAKYLKLATASQENLDTDVVFGGVVGSIALEQATFVPLTAANGAKPPPPPEPAEKKDEEEEKKPAAGNAGAGGGGAAKPAAGAEKDGENEIETEKKKPQKPAARRWLSGASNA